MEPNNRLVRIDSNNETQELNQICPIPIEIAFMFRGVQLLKKKGTIAAIMPSTFVTSIKFEWFRRYLLKTGEIKNVIEFPEFTFNGVESRIYLVIYKKALENKSINISSFKTGETYNINNCTIGLHEYRLDFSSCKAKKSIQKIISSNPSLGWTYLKDYAHVFRGKISTPFNGYRAIHTTDYQDREWKFRYDKKNYLKDFSENSIKDDDILVKRVGRNCSKTFGSAHNLEGFACSDCIIIVRPIYSKLSSAVLLSLRIVALITEWTEILEKGTGAKYMPISNVKNVMIPIDIKKM